MISIIIPLYNVEFFIVECLESVISQTYKDIEIVLVNDNSTDNTIILVEKFFSNLSNIKYKIIHHDKNLGLSSARNTGLNVASGDYIYFLDGDDILETTALENLYRAITSDYYAIAISYFTKYTEGKREVYHEEWLFDNPRVIEPQDFADKMLTEKCNFAATAKLYKKEVLNDVRFRSGIRNEDTLFIVDLFPFIEQNQYKCIEIPDYSYYYRMRPGSICNNPKRPLQMDVLYNYDVAIEACKGKVDTIEWLKQRQLDFIFDLAFRFLKDRNSDGSLYKEICKATDRFNVSYVKATRNKSQYKSFLVLKYLPTIYNFYYRLRHHI